MYKIFDQKGGNITYDEIKQAWGEGSMPADQLPNSNLFRWALRRWKERNQHKSNGSHLEVNIDPIAVEVESSKKDARKPKKKSKGVAMVHVPKYKEAERLLDRVVMLMMQVKDDTLATSLRKSRRQVILRLP
jgi:hypothetical protein